MVAIASPACCAKPTAAAQRRRAAIVCAKSCSNAL